MQARSLTLLSLLLLPGLVRAQMPTPHPAFLAADVHTSPHRKFPSADGGKLYGDRYILRQATLVDLIAAAYGVDPANVQGGPVWLEMDRFDVIAKAPPATPAATLQLMLQALLTERFHLVVRPGTRPMPAFVLSATKGSSKLHASEATSTGEGECHALPPPSGGGPQYIQVACRNMTLAQFAQNLHDMAGGYLTSPVVDTTGLTGTYDLDIRWSPRSLLPQQGADGISIFDAVDKQLGLKLALETAPRPVFIVESADRTPTPNAPGLDKILPEPPPPRFDVATIRPSEPGEQADGRITRDVLDFKAIPLRELIGYAWDLNPNDSEAIVNPPKNLDSQLYDVYGKVLPDPANPGVPSPSLQVQEDLREMLRALVIERFHLQAHMEDRPVSAYTLTTVKPLMRAADPASRTHCVEGPAAGGKDPRVANAMLNRLVTCQNMTMAQLGEELQRLASGYIYNPVQDATGLTGGYDFTLSFSSINLMGSSAKPADPSAAGASAGTASDPNGALSLPDALRRELGLKLDKVKRPAPVLVIEHIDDRPTET